MNPLLKPGLIALMGMLFNTPIWSQMDSDSLMLVHSDRCEVRLHRGLFGLAKPEFCSFNTASISKLDSTVSRKKSRDSTALVTDISSDETDIDHLKYVTISKSRFYIMEMSSGSMASRAVFAIESVSHEKKQTFFGKMISKNDEGKSQVIHYSRDVPGMLYIGDSTAWSFFIDNFTSGGRATSEGITYASLSGGYLKSSRDSIYIRVTSSFSADIVLIGASNEHLAALAYKQRRPLIWIRNDLDSATRLALAAFLGLILSIKDY